jgi:hypothetical protein
MAAPPTEQELSAATLSLLARPVLWPQLHLPAPSPAGAAAAPWATYWATRVDAGLDVAEARALLEASFAAFERAGERVGELLCLAAIIESFYVEEGPLDSLDLWIERLVTRLPQGERGDGGARTWSSDELEARVLACGVGILLRDQSHPLLERWRNGARRWCGSSSPGHRA